MNGVAPMVEYFIIESLAHRIHFVMRKKLSIFDRGPMGQQ